MLFICASSILKLGIRLVIIVKHAPQNSYINLEPYFLIH